MKEGTPPSAPIRVVIAEDQAMVLGALAALLDMESDITVVAQARSGADALEAVRAQQPDVLISDVEMPSRFSFSIACMRIVVGITWASGAIFGIRTLEVL